MERKKIGIIFISSIIFVSILLYIAPWYKDRAQITISSTFISNEFISLPKPSYESSFSIEEALLKRRSTREYSVELLKLDEISQILWAAQGITHEKRLRTAVAHAIQCPYCIDAFSQSCLEKGSNLSEMTEALHVVTAIRGGASLVHGIQMRNVASKLSM